MKGKELVKLARILQYALSSKMEWVGGGVRLYGEEIIIENGYVIVRVPFNSNGFSGGIKGQSFVNTLLTLPEEEDFEIIGEKSKLVIKNSRINMNFGKVDELVELGDYKEISQVQISKDIFRAIKAALPFIGVREVIPALRGVFVTEDCVLSSDNIRIAKIDLEEKVETDMLLLFETARAIVGIAEGRELVKVAFVEGKNLVKFEFGDGVIAYAMLFGYEFPNVKNVFDNVTGEIVDLPEGFIDGCRRLCKAVEGSDSRMRIISNSNGLMIQGIGGSCLYEEKWDGKKLPMKDINLVVAAKEFLEIVEYSELMVISEEQVLFFKGKDKSVSYAMMPLSQDD